MDIRRERAHVKRKGFDFVQQTVGEAILWFEYDAVRSDYHDVYHEDSVTESRSWRPGILVPALWVNITQGVENPSEEGRLVVDTLRLAVSIDALRRTGVSNPSDSRRHLNDIIVYGGSQWNIRTYEKRGRLRDTMLVAVNAVRINEGDEHSMDGLPGFDDLEDQDVDEGFPTDDFDDQVYPDYPLPARQV